MPKNGTEKPSLSTIARKGELWYYFSIPVKCVYSTILGVFR